jgi:putative transposase
VISDAHEGIKAAVQRVFQATWQRCRVHFMRNAMAHAGKQGKRLFAAFIATAFAQDTAEAAKAQWRQVADQIRTKVPKLAALLDEAENDVLAYMTFPKEHRVKIHSTNPIERRNGEIKRRTDVVGIFPNEDAITRLIGAILLEQNDEWAVQRARYMTLETIASLGDDTPHHAARRRGMINPARLLGTRMIGIANPTPLPGTRSFTTPAPSSTRAWILEIGLWRWVGFGTG